MKPSGCRFVISVASVLNYLCSIAAAHILVCKRLGSRIDKSTVDNEVCHFYVCLLISQGMDL